MLLDKYETSFTHSAMRVNYLSLSKENCIQTNNKSTTIRRNLGPGVYHTPNPICFLYFPTLTFIFLVKYLIDITKAFKTWVIIKHLILAFCFFFKLCIAYFFFKCTFFFVTYPPIKQVRSFSCNSH